MRVNHCAAPQDPGTLRNPFFPVPSAGDGPGGWVAQRVLVGWCADRGGERGPVVESVPRAVSCTRAGIRCATLILSAKAASCLISVMATGPRC